MTNHNLWRFNPLLGRTSNGSNLCWINSWVKVYSLGRAVFLPLANVH